MSGDLVEQLDVIAAREGLNRSELIARIVVEWLRNYRVSGRSERAVESGDWLLRKVRDLDDRGWVSL